jgi:hypothetical protein
MLSRYRSRHRGSVSRSRHICRRRLPALVPKKLQPASQPHRGLPGRSERSETSSWETSSWVPPVHFRNARPSPTRSRTSKGKKLGTAGQRLAVVGTSRSQPWRVLRAGNSGRSANQIEVGFTGVQSRCAGGVVSPKSRQVITAPSIPVHAGNSSAGADPEASAGYSGPPVPAGV